MAEHDIRVDINLTVTGGEGGTDSALEPTQQQASPTAKAATANVSNAQSKVVAAYLGTQAIKYATSSYGDLTGNYLGQEKINEAITLGGMAAMIMKSPYLGTAVAVGSLVTKAADYAIDQRKMQQEAQVLRERIGRTISSGGRDL